MDFANNAFLPRPTLRCAKLRPGLTYCHPFRAVFGKLLVIDFGSWLVSQEPPSSATPSLSPGTSFLSPAKEQGEGKVGKDLSLHSYFFQKFSVLVWLSFEV